MSQMQSVGDYAETLDANQRLAFESIVQNLYLSAGVDSVDDELDQEAARIAAECVATAEEAARKVAQLRTGPAYCYLAFYGLDEVASFAKVGMTRHPEQRLYGMATANPLDCLWVFVSKCEDARAAYHVEQSLLRRMAARKRRGEWLTIEATDRDGAEGLARQLTVLARDVEPGAAEFVLLGYTDGR